MPAITAPGQQMIRINFTLDGEALVDRVFAVIEERIENPSPAWPAVVKAFQAIEAEVFQGEGAHTGRPWPQLAPRTQADRRRKGFPPAHPILARTHALERALTLGDGAAAVTTARTLRYRLAPEVGYWVYHQSNKPRSRIPRRATVLLTADDRTKIIHPIRLYVRGQDPDAVRRSAIR